MTFARSTSLVGLTMLAASLGLAQGPTPPTPPAPPAPPHGQRYSMDRSHMRDGQDHGMDRGSSHGNMGIVPPGTWWKNPDIITKLSLTTDQQKKMDEILQQNRLALVDLKASLEKEEINLEPLLNANPVDSAKSLAEISKIADLRAGLEKANAKMLLGLRSVLSADQWTKLQEDRHASHRPGAGDGGAPGRGAGPGRGPGGRPGSPPTEN